MLLVKEETMDGITKQTRRQSYDGIRTRSGEVYETAGQSADDHQTTSGRNNMKVVKIAPAKEA